jgi:hypothetical protein
MGFWVARLSPEGVPYYLNTQTNETTWDKPTELMSAEERDTGEYWWIPCETHGYVFGKVVNKPATGAIECQAIAGQPLDTPKLAEAFTISVPRKQASSLVKAKRSALEKIVDDLVQAQKPMRMRALADTCRRFGVAVPRSLKS